ncbi:PH domain-containing protein [Nocardioides panacis]|uniref:PH domain-containing protein n=1 Tax=Nocardioides panacis TaxID=2849501 RepID=A0A975SWQ2_9ACTN|nr:PH domain-containing protein [Nocardioides panacis]QWZ07231.1 PH domain-containing protein [Nocardioides panacis]
MDDLFAPPGNDWRPVSPALARLRRSVLGAAGVVGLVLVVVATLLWSLPVLVWLPAVVVLLALLAWGWLLIGRNAQWWAYAERDEDLYVKHGVLFRAMVVVPYGRMQYVDVQAGPLEQLFKIASVHLHTASPGTSARIPGLPADEAARLRDRLTSQGEAQAAGL